MKYLIMTIIKGEFTHLDVRLGECSECHGYKCDSYENK